MAINHPAIRWQAPAHRGQGDRMYGYGGVKVAGGGSEVRIAQPGDHICMPFVNAAARDGAVAEFVVSGLQRKEQVAILGSRAMQEKLGAFLDTAGYAFAELQMQRRVLVFLDDLGYRPDGTFDAAAIHRSLVALAKDAKQQGFTHFRAVGEPPQDVPRDQLMNYEAGLGEAVKHADCTVLCLYCKTQCPPGLVRDLLAVHPQVLLGDRLCHNAFFDPNAFQEGRTPNDARQLDWQIHQILRTRDPYDFSDGRSSLGEARGDYATSEGPLSLARGLEARDKLLAMVDRRLRSCLLQLSAAGTEKRSDEVRETMEQLLHLSERLGAVAAFVGQRHRYDPRALDLASLVAAQVRQLSSEQPRRGVLSVTADQPVTGRFDPQGITQVMQHVLRLALRHACQGRVEVTIEKLGPTARISVRYQALDGVTVGATLSGSQQDAEVYDWVGIDLFFARELLRSMGGTLTMASWPDESVVVTLELPRHTLTPVPVS